MLKKQQAENIAQHASATQKLETIRDQIHRIKTVNENGHLFDHLLLFALLAFCLNANACWLPGHSHSTLENNEVFMTLSYEVSAESLSESESHAIVHETQKDGQEVQPLVSD